MPFPYKHANGGICCSNIDHPCDSCKAKLTKEKFTVAGQFAPPDPYAAAIAERREQEQRERERNATPATIFNDLYKQERQRQLDAELQRAKERTR